MIEKINNIFHLSGRDMSYVIVITDAGAAVHSYFGKKIRVNENYKSDLILGEGGWAPMLSTGETYEKSMTEYPSYGYADLHYPAYQAKNSDGNYISYLEYKDYKIYNGTYEIEGMPELFEGENHAQTLELMLEDKLTGLEVTLMYTVFEEYNIILLSIILAKS